MLFYATVIHRKSGLPVHDITETSPYLYNKKLYAAKKKYRKEWYTIYEEKWTE